MKRMRIHWRGIGGNHEFSRPRNPIFFWCFSVTRLFTFYPFLALLSILSILYFVISLALT